VSAINLAPRPTVYKGIPMRSRLEAKAAADLDLEGARWIYEPRAYADETGQWLPDFEVWAPGPHGETLHYLLEVKPTEEAALGAVAKVRPVFASLPRIAVMIDWPAPSVWSDHWSSLLVRRDSWRRLQ
jgi:hypothetical protein